MRLLIVLTALLVPYFLNAQLSEDSSELEFGGQPPRPSPDGPPFPRFLMHVPRFARKEFFDIVSNEKLSQDQQNDQLTIWAKAFNVTDEFNTWAKQVQEQKEAVSQNVQAVVANISTVYNQLERILSNTNLTRRDQHDQIDKLGVTFPREVRALFFIARNYRPESKTPVFGLQQEMGRGMGMKTQTSMNPFGFQQQQPSHSMMMLAPPPFMFGRINQLNGQGNQIGPGFGPQSDSAGRRGPQGGRGGLGSQNGRGGQEPDFGSQFQQGIHSQGQQFGSQSKQEIRGGLGQSSESESQDYFSRRRGPEGLGRENQQGQGLGSQFAKRQFPRGPRNAMNSDSTEDSNNNNNFDSQNSLSRKGLGSRSGRGDQEQDFGPRPQGPDFKPSGGRGGRGGQGPDFGPSGGRGGRGGQGPDFGPSDDFPDRREPGGPPGGRGGQGPDFGPQDDFPDRRGPGGPPGGRGGRGGQRPDFGPSGGRGGRGEQGPDFGPQDDFPDRRGPGGPPGNRGDRRGQGPDFGPSGGRGSHGGQGPDFGPSGGRGGRGGQGPDFGPSDDFPDRRGPGGPPGGRGGQEPDFGPSGGRGGRGGQKPDFGPSGGRGGRGGQGPDFGPSGGRGGRGGQEPDFGPRPQGPDFEPGSQRGQNGRQFDKSSSSSAPFQKYFERQMNSGMRFDQSSGFGMRRASQSTQQDNVVANDL